MAREAYWIKLAIIISYPTSASRIIVLLKMPQNINLPTLFCKNKQNVTMCKDTFVLTPLHVHTGYNGS